MNSDQIAAYLSFLLSPKPTFVLARDELPTVNLSSLPVSIVVNTEDRKLGGKHWCAFYVHMYRSNLVGYFFDSYNNPYQYYGFEPPFQVVGSNSKVLQSSTSETCGNWCIVWLYHMVRSKSKSKSLKSFDAKYSKNLDKNDSILMREFSTFGARSYDTIDHCQTCCCRIKSKY